MGAIDTHNRIKKLGYQDNMKIFALVHDSILAEVKEDKVAEYNVILQEEVQKNRGISIPGTPVGCDFDVHDDYSLGKFEKKYEL